MLQEQHTRLSKNNFQVNKSGEGFVLSLKRKESFFLQNKTCKVVLVGKMAKLNLKEVF